MADPTPTQVSSPPAYASAPRRKRAPLCDRGDRRARGRRGAGDLHARRPLAAAGRRDPRGPGRRRAEVGRRREGDARCGLEEASSTRLRRPPRWPSRPRPSSPRVHRLRAPPSEAPAAAPRPAPGATASAGDPRAPRPRPQRRLLSLPAAPPRRLPRSRSADVWTQMRDEMARCSSSSVIPRIQCERRIRARYCEGYWGTVPECRPATGARSRDTRGATFAGPSR
jgi:hypothetical protein